MGGTATTNQGNGIAIGYRAQFQVKDGSSGVAVGNSALENLVGQYSTAVGDTAGRYATGSYNTFVGNTAGAGSNSAPYASGERNVALGYGAYSAFTTGYRNVAIGDRAGSNVTTGHSGVYIGYLAGYGGNQSGNIAIGAEALFTANNNSNVAIGYQAGRYTTSNDGVWIGTGAGSTGAGGGQSVLVGHYAGQYMVGSEVTHVGKMFNTSGSRNTFVGGRKRKLLPYSSSQYNVAVGYNILVVLQPLMTASLWTMALVPIRTGIENTIIGYDCDVASGDNTNNVIIGNNHNTDKDNTVFIGNDTNHINDFNRPYLELFFRCKTKERNRR